MSLSRSVIIKSKKQSSKKSNNTYYKVKAKRVSRCSKLDSKKCSASKKCKLTKKTANKKAYCRSKKNNNTHKMRFAFPKNYMFI